LPPEPNLEPGESTVGDEIQADRVSPEQPGPGDSEGDYPASPTEDDEEQQG
jgi:hypothetical protein